MKKLKVLPILAILMSFLSFFVLFACSSKEKADENTATGAFLLAIDAAKSANLAKFNELVPGANLDDSLEYEYGFELEQLYKVMLEKVNVKATQISQSPSGVTLQVIGSTIDINKGINYVMTDIMTDAVVNAFMTDYENNSESDTKHYILGILKEAFEKNKNRFEETNVDEYLEMVNVKGEYKIADTPDNMNALNRILFGSSMYSMDTFLLKPFAQEDQ